MSLHTRCNNSSLDRFCKEIASVFLIIIYFISSFFFFKLNTSPIVQRKVGGSPVSCAHVCMEEHLQFSMELAFYCLTYNFFPSFCWWHCLNIDKSLHRWLCKYVTKLSFNSLLLIFSFSLTITNNSVWYLFWYPFCLSIKSCFTRQNKSNIAWN